MANKPEIIAELCDTPMGEFGLRKRLTLTQTDKGKVYSIRTYAPRPVPEKPESYVPARGIDLTEEELKEFIPALQKNLYYFRKRLWNEDTLEEHETLYSEYSEITDEQEPNEELIALKKYCEENDDLEFCYDDDDTLCHSYDFEDEFECTYVVTIKTLKAEQEGHFKRLSILSWRKESSCYLYFDIREWRKGITKKGYSETIPIIDKGISLTDNEAEKLCMIVETMFPETMNGIEEFCNEDYETKSMVISNPFTKEERYIIRQSLDYIIDDIIETKKEKEMYGFQIGTNLLDEQLETLVLPALHKLENDEPIDDVSYETYVNSLNAYYNYLNDNDEFDEDIEDVKALRDKAYKMLNERDKNTGFDSADFDADNTSIEMSEGEAKVIRKILEELRDKLYDDKSKLIDNEDLKEYIDTIVTEDIEKRNNIDDLCDDYARNAGKRFIDNLIDTFCRNAC